MLLSGVLAAALVAAQALPAWAAQAPEEVFREYFKAEIVAKTIVDQIAGNPAVTTWLMRIGVLLAALFFLYNLHMALLTQQSGWVTEALLRAAVVGTVFANLGFVAQTIVDLHKAMSAIGGVVFDALAGPVRFGETLVNLDRARELVRQAIGNHHWADLGAHIRSLQIVFMTYVPMFLFLLFIGFAIALYNFLLISSYLMLGLAVIMIPISIACFVTRSMQRFTYEWFQVILHSSIIALLAKAAVGLIANMAILEQMNGYANRVMEAAQNGGDVIRAASLQVGDIVPVILGTIVGAFTMLNIQGIASAFVGRVESVAGAVAGMYFAMRAVPAAARFGAETAVKWGPAAVSGAYSAAGSAIDALAQSRAGQWAYGQYQAARQHLEDSIRAAQAAVGAMFDRTLPGRIDPSRYRQIMDETEEYFRRRDWRHRPPDEPPPPGGGGGGQDDDPPDGPPPPEGGGGGGGYRLPGGPPSPYGPDYDRYFPRSPTEQPRPPAGEQRRLFPDIPPDYPPGRLQPTEEDMPTEPIWDPNWPPLDE